jgi:hypothetical protein
VNILFGLGQRKSYSIRRKHANGMQWGGWSKSDTAMSYFEQFSPNSRSKSKSTPILIVFHFTHLPLTMAK